MNRIGQPKCATQSRVIATILSDMNTEIAALKAKLAKARSLKQGMMQELLTGRIGWYERQGRVGRRPYNFSWRPGLGHAIFSKTWLFS